MLKLPGGNLVQVQQGVYMNKEKMICNCGYKAEDRPEFEEHINACESVGTDDWEANTTL